MTTAKNLLLWLTIGILILVFVSSALAADEWESADIGDTKKGSTDIQDDVMTIKANGADIWGAADAFRYVYQEVSGDFEISAHFTSQERQTNGPRRD